MHKDEVPFLPVDLFFFSLTEAQRVAHLVAAFEQMRMFHTEHTGPS